MKKISLLLAAAAVVTMGFTSCEEDRGPKYQNPTEFVLNQPAMEDQYIDLHEGNTLELVASQPDYGYSAVAQYGVEMSLTENFADPYYVTPLEPTLARMSLKQEDIALGMCTLLGIESEDMFNEMYPTGMPYMKVYFRATCQLDGVESSKITSNTVAYNNIKGYFAVQTPGYIYLVGSPEGWSGPEESNAAHYAPWRLYEPENAIGSKIYTATFDLPASPMFRFYTALTGWDADSYGSQVEDNPIDFELVDGSFSGTLMSGKGSFNFPNFAGGKCTLVVDMSDPNNMTFTMYAGEVTPVITQYVYMVGNNGGWTEPVEGTYEDWKLADTTGTGIYEGTFDFTDFSADGGVLYCRFYQHLTGWGAADWSASTDSSENVPATSGVALPTFLGEGCFTFEAAGHKVSVVLDTNLNQVTFTYAD